MAKNVLLTSSNPQIVEDDLVMKTGEAIKPGHLVDLDATPEVIKHVTAGAALGAVRVAAEHPTSQKTAEQAYADGENVPYYVNPAEFRGYLKLGENVARGALLESAGGGELRAHVPQAVDEGGTATFNVVVAPLVGVAKKAANATSAVVRVEVTLLR